MAEQNKATTMEAIKSINAVDGFDPESLAVDYTDLNSSETRKRLPVMSQLAWFRLKYPEGRIAVSVVPGKDCFVATAQVYRSCTDAKDQFLSEATASRGYLADKPTVSPREWAQTAAIGIALRNAGFGLQFGVAGDAVDTPAVDELSGIVWTGSAMPAQPPMPADSSGEATGQSVPTPEPEPLSPLERAMRTPCPIDKYQGKTLGEVLQLEPKAVHWVATKYSKDPTISQAAKLICEHALESA